MRVKITCLYCNKNWVEECFYETITYTDDKKCPVCKDTHLKVEDLNKKINYYKTEEDETENEDSFDSFGLI